MSQLATFIGITPKKRQSLRSVGLMGRGTSLAGTVSMVGYSVVFGHTRGISLVLASMVFGASYCAPVFAEPSCKEKNPTDGIERALQITAKELSDAEIKKMLRDCRTKIKSGNLKVREEAARTFEKLGEKGRDAAADLIKIIYKEFGTKGAMLLPVFRSLIFASGGTDKAIVVLERGLWDKDAKVRAKTALILAFFFSVAPANAAELENGKEGGPDSLNSVRGTISKLLEMALNESDVTARASTIYVLRIVRQSFVKEIDSRLRSGLESENPNARLRTVEVMWMVDETRYNSDIVQAAISDSDGQVRATAMGYLKNWHSKECYEEMHSKIRAALKDGSADVRAHAAELAGYISEKLIKSPSKEQVELARALVPELSEALKDPDSSVRGLAAASLVFAGREPPDVLQHLQAVLFGSDAVVRLRALEAIHKMGDPAVEKISADIPALLEDPDGRVSIAAMKVARGIETTQRPLRQRKSVYDVSLQEILSSSNRLAFDNPPGPLNTGLCWWHTQMQRNAFYLADFQPDKPHQEVKYYQKAIRDLGKGDRIVQIQGFKNLHEFSAAYRSDFIRVLAEMQGRDIFPNGIVSLFRLAPNPKDIPSNRIAYKKLIRQLDDGKLPIVCFGTGRGYHNYLVFRRKEVTSDTVEFFAINSTVPSGIETFYWDKKKESFGHASESSGIPMFFGGWRGDGMGTSVIRTTEYPAFEKSFKSYTGR